MMPNDTLLKLRKTLIEKYQVNVGGVELNIVDFKFYTIWRNKKLGIIPFDTTLFVLEPVFDKIVPEEWDFIKLYKAKKIGVINFDGKLMFPPKFDKIDIIQPPYAQIWIDGKQGVVDYIAGKYSLKPSFDKVEIMHPPYAFIKSNEKYGVANYEKGKITIEPEYAEYFDLFLDDDFFLILRKEGNYGIKNKSGKTIHDFEYDDLHKLIEEVVGYKEHRIYDAEHNLISSYIVDGDYDWNFLDYDAYAIHENGKYGLKYKSEIKIKPKFDSIYLIDDTDTIVANQDSLYGCFDFSGNQVLDFQPFEIVGFSKGFYKVKANGKYGLIDKEGDKITTSWYDEIHNFSNDLARCKKDGKYGYINYFSSNYIVEPFSRYLNATDFQNGIASVAIDKAGSDLIWIIINTKEEQVVTITHKFYQYSAPEISDDLIIFRKNNLYGIMDMSGEIIISPRYTFAYINDYSKLISVERFGVKHRINYKGEFIDWDSF